MTVNDFGVKVGDIFYCSWGYDQTNIDYYKITRVTKTKAEVTPIGSKVVDADPFAGGSHNKVVPNPDYVREYDVLIGVERSDEFKSKLCTVKAGWGDRKATIVLKSGQHWAYPWEGKPLSETDAWSGH